ncbi:hypothetical protein [Streptomyces sp. NPDC001315]|uniref:hypothetical protein n=1 Tax=Streptomyces sp. NPDC001315 TaxID=3364562 RepID=UPI0036C1BBF6
MVGWSIDASSTTSLTTNALALAIGNPSPRSDTTVIHSDRGVELGSGVNTMGMVTPVEHELRPSRPVV